MRAEDVTVETFSKAFRNLRLSAGFTQNELAMRTGRLKPPLKPVTAVQISRYERGEVLPNFATLVSILVACSADGATLDFSLLQKEFGANGNRESPFDGLWEKLIA